jgi:hypothetical protein
MPCASTTEDWRGNKNKKRIKTEAPPDNGCKNDCCIGSQNKLSKQLQALADAMNNGAFQNDPKGKSISVQDLQGVLDAV